jgi:putative ATP-dependent endonuclease of OLD family
VIDFQNNGNAESFVALARGLKIPWLMVVDGDQEGRNYLRRVERRGVTPAEMNRRCSTLPAGRLEEQLIADGIQVELREILLALGHQDAPALDDAGLVARLTETKTAYAAALSSRCASDAVLATRTLETFRNAITACRGLQ